MYENLSRSELVELIRKQTGRRASLTNTREELLGIIDGKEGKFSTEGTRRRLQVFIEKNWDSVQTNLPCRGESNEGKCKIFKCTDIRHLDCFLQAKQLLLKSEEEECSVGAS